MFFNCLFCEQLNDKKTLDIFSNELNPTPPKKNYITNKTDVYLIHNSWSFDILDSNDYGPEKKQRLKISFCSNW